MSEAPSVLLLDDGELEDLARVLREADVPFARLRGESVGIEMAPPRDLLVCTPRRASAVRRPAAGERGARPIRVISVVEDSRAMRLMLREMGFQLLVRRPTHAEVWRLLVRRALFGGEERRAQDRVPVGVEVQLRVGGRRRTAVLLDLSENGCRVACSEALRDGEEVVVEIPEPGERAAPLRLEGRSVRAAAQPEADGSVTHTVAIRFEQRLLGEGERRRLGMLLDRWAVTPGATRGGPAEAGEAESERRAHPRGPFRDPVGALLEPQARVLIGRDLSAGGMRVEPVEGVSVGTRLEVVVYTPNRPDALRIQASVLRDDGDDGLALRFEEVTPDVAQELEKLVACLPDVESLELEEAERLGSVLSELRFER
jgi:hypothetical protein